MAEHWTSHRFSLRNPQHDGADDLPRLLRRLADQIEEFGIRPMEVDDLTLSQEITADGPWFAATVYWTPGEAPDAAPESEGPTAAVPSPVTSDVSEPTAPSEDPVRVPVAEALPGVELYPLPVEERVVSAFAMMKTRDDDGEPGWYTRVTRNFNRLEFLGALSAYVDSVRAAEAAGWADDDDEAPHSHADIDT